MTLYVLTLLWIPVSMMIVVWFVCFSPDWINGRPKDPKDARRRLIAAEYRFMQQRHADARGGPYATTSSLAVVPRQTAAE